MPASMTYISFLYNLRTLGNNQLVPYANPFTMMASLILHVSYVMSQTLTLKSSVKLR